MAGCSKRPLIVSARALSSAYSLIEVGEQQLVDVRYAPFATKMVRRRECSDGPLAKICKRTLGITTTSQKYFRKAQTAPNLTTVDANGLACISRLRLMGLLSRTNTVLHIIL
jgi:hypothetical protein